MEKAKGLVNIALEAKTTWNTKDLVAILDQVYQTSKFSNPMARRAFYGVCDSFKTYIYMKSLNAMGRNQFLNWFRIECVSQMNAVILGKGTTGYDPTAGVTPNIVDDFATVDQESPTEEVARLRRENAELKGTISALQNQYAKMEPILNAFTALLKDFKL